MIALAKKSERFPGLGLERLGPLLLALATLVLYAPTLGNGFTNWDDPRYVEQNPFATKGLLGIPLAFLSSHDDAYYPVTHAIYSLIQAFFGTSALAHHAVQVGIFAAGVALLPWALAAFGIPAASGFWIALLWAVHPMRVESVSWVANLKDTAAFLGLVVAFGAHGQGRRKLSIFAFLLALLAKSMFFPLAGLFVLLERRTSGWKTALRRAAPHLVVAASVALLGAYLHVLPAEMQARTRPGGSLLAAIPSVLWLPWWYLGRSLVLAEPQTVHSYQPVGWVDPRLFVALAAWGLLAIFLWRSPFERRPARLLGVAAWCLPFLPVTGLVPLVLHLADRYAFLPSLPVVAGIVLLVGEHARRLPRWGLAVAGIAAVAVQGAMNVPRQLHFRDSISLWEVELPREPENPTVRYHLARAYGAAERWDDAIAQLEALDALQPSLEARYGIAYARLAKVGIPPEKRPAVATQLSLAKDPTLVWLNLVQELLTTRDLDRARAVLASLPRERAEVVLHYGMLEAAEGRPEEALRRVEEAIGLEPSLDQAHLYRATLLAGLGRDEELVALADVHLESSRDRALLAKERAMAFLRLRRFGEALAATEVEVEEEHRPILGAARAAALLLLGRTEEARRVAERGGGPGADRELLQAVLEQTRHP